MDITRYYGIRSQNGPRNSPPKELYAQKVSGPPPPTTLKTRKDALDRTTSDSYIAFSQLSQIDYTNDATVDFFFDAAGRRTGMTDGSGQTGWTPDAWSRSVSSTQSMTGRSLTYSFNGLGQRTGVTYAGGGLAARSMTYGYDTATRLHTVIDSAVSAISPFIYGYQPGTRWVSQITTPSGSTITNSRDAMGRVKNTSFLAESGLELNHFDYLYNAAGQREEENGPRGDIDFFYNTRGELTGAEGVLGEDYTYGFDGIGNRLTASGPGFATAYQPNELNQYAEIVEGAGTLVPIHDLNGNMTADGQGAQLSYDDENRLIAFEKGSKRSEFVYDGLGRRVETKEFQSASLVKTIRYVYDGLLPVEEIEWAGTAIGTPVAVRQLTRGTDLSGSLEGAGGIGGLLAYSNGTTRAWYFADGNGNVANLFKSDNNVAAAYVYDPFGRRLSATGSLALSNTYQWSSKEHHEPSGLVYYLYRYYNPETGRWVNRDPILENGGLNLYGMVGNSPSGFVDRSGLDLVNVVVISSPFLPAQTSASIWASSAASFGGPLILGEGIVAFSAGAFTSSLGATDWLLRPIAIDFNGVGQAPAVARTTGAGSRAVSYERAKAKAKQCNRCVFSWIPDRGGNVNHNKTSAQLNGNEFADMLVATPEGLAVSYDAAIPGPFKLPPHTVIEVKTGHRWAFFGTGQKAWINSRAEQFSLQSAVAFRCGLNFQVFVDNSIGREGLKELFPLLKFL